MGRSRGEARLAPFEPPERDFSSFPALEGGQGGCVAPNEQGKYYNNKGIEAVTAGLYACVPIASPYGKPRLPIELQPSACPKDTSHQPSNPLSRPPPCQKWHGGGFLMLARFDKLRRQVDNTNASGVKS